MYEDYFGLERPPFKITPDTSLFYEGGKRGDILDALVYAIQRGEGIVKVVGEVGSGKTMLCRMLQLKLPDSVEIVYIANPSVSPEDILFVIAHELSLPVSREASKHKVMHSLQDYLLKRHMENRQVVLFVEEAQGMPLETLEEIRLLSNLETDQNKLLQIILFGQPELDENLSKQSIRQLRERITHNFNLEPLSREEIYNYLNFRMREVGYRGPELINRAVAKKVEQHSGGLLRRINIIADKILLSAYAEGTHNLSAKHVDAAVNDSAFDSVVTRRGGAIWWFALLLLAALLFALYQTRGEWLSAAAAVVSPEQLQARDIDGATADAEFRQLTARQPAGGRSSDTAEHHGSGMPLPAEVVEIAFGVGSEVGRTSTQTLVDPAADILNSGEDFEVIVETEQAVTVVAQIPSLRPPSAVDNETPGRSAPAADDGRQHVKPLAIAAVRPASDVDGTPKDSAARVEDEYGRWLDAKLEQSREWLSGVDGSKVSIQVMVREKSAVRELVYYLLNDWPLDLSRTYVYEVNLKNRSIYRILYSEFDTVAVGKRQIEKLPDSVKNNSPYLHSIHRLQKGLL